MAVNFRNLRNAGTFRRRKTSGPENPLPFKTQTRVKLSPDEIPVTGNLRMLTGLSAPLSRLCFFDTETTGLSGGAGSMIFQAGVGYFEGNGLVVDQFFISSPADEPAFLSALTEILKFRPAVVTYNGKSFDIPLLNTRLILNRMEELRLNVIDLLHVSRSVWKHHMPSFRLIDVEQRVLGIFRKNDLPGSMVPGVYRNYILGRDSGEIREVLRHNRQDIISLARLLSCLASSCKDEDDPHVLLALAGKHLQNKNADACINAASRCLCGPVPEKVRAETLWLASLALKRRGELARAAKVWARLSSRQAKIELAKYLEHTAGDYEAALRVVNRLLRADNMPPRIRHLLLHRRNRLRKKSCNFRT
ncbi:MAG: ribonuclease H-like domain-containing protein [Acidobacteria bacterium]|nr:ribonuclease H-like domain-containing protein [Acidobacteriota bacterium]